MLNKKQIEEIRQHLDNAQNPLFLFDNDPDGLCSFLILQKYIGRGKGFPIKGPPELSVDYFRKISELNADYIFVLDKPLISKEFFDEAEKINIPIVWIDHHHDQKNIPSFVNYYNPDTEINYPTTYYCFQVSQKEEDLWLAVLGSISDRFFPNYYSRFLEKYPDVGIDSKDTWEIAYKSQLGKIERIFRFGLKDTTTNVIKMLKFLMKAKSPYDIISESTDNYSMHKRFSEVEKKYKKLVNKAVEVGKNSGDVLFFEYGGDLSISSDLSNEICYRFPNKVVAIAYVDESKGKANISLRGKKVKRFLKKILEGFENSTGGGHEDAVGISIRKTDVEKFHESLVKSAEGKV